MGNNNDLLQIILYALCGLVCVGMGVYYFVTANNTQGGIFTAVGVISVVLSVRFLIKFLKNKKNKNDEGKDDDNKHNFI